DAMTLLMRTADKTGAFSLVRSTARAQRRAAAASPTGEPSAHALFASAYVFAKYYWPERALPLLERARCRAEREQNWELEHACRDGIGVVLKQLGRFRDSAEQIRLGLAFAKRTLNPQAQATSLVNLAVSETALGEYEAAAIHLEESADIDAKFPRWPHRVYRYYNQADLAVETGRLDEAIDAYQRALALASEMNVWQVVVIACAGLARVAWEKKLIGESREWCVKMRAVLVGKEHALTERWPVESALAWDACSRGKGAEAVARLRVVLRELSRRDADQWLRLRLETVRVSEEVAGKRSTAEREELRATAQRFGASAIVAAAQEIGATSED
ncbi:MAG TPA: tetratricopeptide repeat protein, partial [Candidatus Margulisiibacteriota bacterium]|nr:tetratricopeptide repeat protein [Candidatus Margulisiibacteriota bacterium]